MPTKLETAVYGMLAGDGGERWKACLRAHVKESILKRARSLLGLPPLALPAEWDSLDDIEYRTATAGTVEECAEEVARRLSLDDTLFAEFKAAVEGVGLGLSRAKLVNALRPELPKLIDPAAVRAYAEAVIPESLWSDLANLIAMEIHAAESKNPPQSEADCLHWSLLAAFFQVTQIPDAARLGKTIHDCLTRGRFNVRGSLLRNVERTSDMGIVDTPLSHVAFAPVVLAPATAQHRSYWPPSPKSRGRSRRLRDLRLPLSARRSMPTRRRSRRKTRRRGLPRRWRSTLASSGISNTNTPRSACRRSRRPSSACGARRKRVPPCILTRVSRGRLRSPRR